MKILRAFLCLTLLFAGPFVAAEPESGVGKSTTPENFDPSDVYFQGYLAGREAEKLEVKGDFSGAAEKLKTSNKLVESVRTYFPKWKKEMVDRRIAKNNQELDRLSPKTAEQEKNDPSAKLLSDKNLLPGVALSQGITEITGVAISPLLGVSAVGAWRYWQTPQAARDGLPWYAQPWAWGTGLAILSLCFLKDSLGTTVPGILKKPFDMVELFEDKASALVASGAFVPLVAQEMAKHLEAKQAISIPTASIGTLGFTTIDAAWFMVPAAVVAFLTVWVCSHAINVLIVLSPFSTLDALLKLARTGVLLFVTLLYAVAPWLAAALCLVIIAIAVWFAPAAMRLMIFGARYATDILLPWRARKKATPEQPHAFTLGRVTGLPPRTGGRVVLLEDGTMAFRYRRFCILDVRTIPLPGGRSHVEKGLLSPSMIHRADEPDEQKLLLFLPRYRSHEQAIATHLKLHGVREHAVARGFKAVKGWVKSLATGTKVLSSGN